MATNHMEMAESAPKLEKTTAPVYQKRPHIIPPSGATHPKDRWETLYVYMFIRKFTTLRDEVLGFTSPDDLERALLDDSGEPDFLLEQIILRFILNLRPNTRNTSSHLIPTTLYNLLHEFHREPGRQRDRTAFHEDEPDTFIHPLKDVEGGFWKASWDVKLRILRQLVDWQLTYSATIREVIDVAWSFRQKPHKRKAEAPKPPPNPGEPGSREILQFKPVGMDQKKLRFWVADSSPRLYTSTNPWKVTQQFSCAATTRDEYIQWIDKLREQAPPEPEDIPGKTTSRSGTAHWDLIYALEMRVDEIDLDLKRVEGVRKKQAQIAERQLLEKDDPSHLTRSQARGRTSQQGDSDESDHNHLTVQNGQSSRSVRSGYTTPNSMMASEIDDDSNDEDSDDVNQKHNKIEDDQSDDDADDDADDDDDDDGEEIDELQDDSSLNGSDGPEQRRSVRKRPRITASPTDRETRSIRKKRRKPDSTAHRTNGKREQPKKPEPPKERLESLKNSKGRPTKFWYFEEDPGAPAKRPEMLDDPDAMLRKRSHRKSEKGSTDFGAKAPEGTKMELDE